MSYENKEYILQFFEGVHEEDNKAELIEVYRKAEAFDYILNKKNEVEDDIYKFAIVREESAHQYLGYEVFKFISEYESGEYDAKQ